MPTNAELMHALKWCLDNLGAGIEWGGPFDKQHLQGVYHCTHCEARWKPQADGRQYHKANCGLEKVMLLVRGDSK
jgi:hypothetical protein